MVGIPIPSRMLVTMPITSIGSRASWASSRSAKETFAPRPVSVKMLTTIPAHAQASATCSVAIVPARSALRICRGDKRLAAFKELTATVATIAQKPDFVGDQCMYINMKTRMTGGARKGQPSERSRSGLGSSDRSIPRSPRRTASRSTAMNTAT